MLKNTQTAAPKVAPSVAAMLEENRRRCAAPKFDPISGLGSTGKRKRVCIKGLEPEVQYIPPQMAADPFVRELVKAGSLDALNRRLEVGATRSERESLREKWCRMRCAHDFPFWAARYVKIKNKEGDITPFRLNAPQRRLIECFEEMRLAERPIRLVLVKARQWGGSTATQLYMAWIQLIHRVGWNSLIVGHQSASAAEVGSMFELMMQNYPHEMLYEQGADFNPREPRLTNLHGTTSTRVVPQRNAKIKFGTAERPHSVRGGDSSMVHCTEVAFWKRTEGRTPTQMMKAATSGVLYRPLTMIVYESSANGTGNFFHNEYDAAKRGLSQFRALFVAWYEIEQYRLPFVKGNAPAEQLSALVPRFPRVEQLAEWMLRNRYADDPLSGRTVSGRYLWSLWEKGATLEAINWYLAERTKYTDQNDMASEFPSDDIEAFANSGARVFRLERLTEMRPMCDAVAQQGDIDARAAAGPDSLRDVRFTPDSAGRLKVWEMPRDTAGYDDRYIVTVDIGGRSAKADWSVVWVADRAPMAWGAPVRTVAQWRGHIDMDRLAWKAAQIAAFYGNALLIIESNTIETNEADRFVDGDQSLFLFSVLRDAYPNLYYRANGKPGFHTNISTKPMVISTLVQAVRDGLYEERDAECLDELACYERRPDGSFGAITGRHDDMLMTRAIGLHVAINELDPPSVTRRGFRTNHQSQLFDKI